MIHAALAHWIYDILVKECNANPDMREAFVVKVGKDPRGEWRFGGKLGFGGKFWWTERGSYTVNAYSDDDTPAIRALQDRVNTTLARARVEGPHVHAPSPPGKYLVLEGLQHRNRFCTLATATYESDLYRILGTAETLWDAQAMLGIPVSDRAPRDGT